MNTARQEPEVELRLFWMTLHARGSVAKVIAWALAFVLVAFGIAMLVALVMSRFHFPKVALTSFG